MLQCMHYFCFIQKYTHICTNHLIPLCMENYLKSSLFLWSSEQSVETIDCTAGGPKRKLTAVQPNSVYCGPGGGCGCRVKNPNRYFGSLLWFEFILHAICLAVNDYHLNDAHLCQVVVLFLKKIIKAVKSIFVSFKMYT